MKLSKEQRFLLDSSIPLFNLNMVLLNIKLVQLPFTWFKFARIF